MEVPSTEEIALRTHDEACSRLEDARRSLLAAWKAGAGVVALKELEGKIGTLLRQEASLRGQLTRRGLEPRSTVER